MSDIPQGPGELVLKQNMMEAYKKACFNPTRSKDWHSKKLTIRNINTTCTPMNLNWFYQKVRNGGSWDYKQQNRNWEAFGNFHYGAVGTALGLPEQLLLRAAGWAQTRAGTSEKKFGNWYDISFTKNLSYGDDPKDQHWIKRGIKYARKMGY